MVEEAKLQQKKVFFIKNVRLETHPVKYMLVCGFFATKTKNRLAQKIRKGSTPG